MGCSGGGSSAGFLGDFCTIIRIRCWCVGLSKCDAKSISLSPSLEDAFLLTRLVDGLQIECQLLDRPIPGT